MEWQLVGVNAKTQSRADTDACYRTHLRCTLYIQVGKAVPATSHSEIYFEV